MVQQAGARRAVDAVSSLAQINSRRLVRIEDGHETEEGGILCPLCEHPLIRSLLPTVSEVSP